MRPNSKRYIRFTIDDELSAAQQAPWAHRPRPACGQRCNRCLRFTGFCLVCTGTLFQAVAPWVLSVVEAVGVLLMCFLLVPHPLEPPRLAFDFRLNLEDVAAASVLRAAVISGTYAYGMRRQYLRPYLYTAYAAGGAGLVFALAKAFFFEYGSAWAPQAAMIGVFGAFSWVHVLAARNAVAWARKRAALGLATFPWEPGLQEGLLPSRHSTPGSDGGSVGGGGDVPPELLADPDSNFTPVGELWVHWKEALPAPGAAPRRPPPAHAAGAAAQQQHGGVPGAGAQGASMAPEGSPTSPGFGNGSFCGGGGGDDYDPESTAVVLIHSGGGGAFAWRNVMGDLAERCGVRVVAFDRPAFGLTSRPPAPPAGSGRPDPYSPAAQAALVLQLCGALGVRRAVLAAHGDGCLVAVMAAALAGRHGSASTGGLGGARRISISQLGGRHDESPDLGLVSSLGSSEADLLAPSSASRSQDSRRRPPPDGGGARDGGGGSPFAAGRGAPGARFGSGSGSGGEAASLAASISFQSLLARGESGSGHGSLPGSFPGSVPEPQARHGEAGSSANEPPPSPSQQGQQQQQQQQPRQAAGQQRRPPSRLSHQAAAGAQEQPNPQQHEAGWPADSAGAHPTPPELQAMTPTGGSASLAPQLWPCAAPAPQQERDASRGGAPAGGFAPPRRQSGEQQAPSAWQDGSFIVLSDGDGDGGGGGDAAYGVEVLGLALLHPRLSGQTVGGFTRLLARAKLGSAMLRPLLRSEIGEVSNRRAWHRGDRCTRQVLELYRRPLRAEGWDAALLAASAAADRGVSRRAAARALAALRASRTRALVATGAHDRISTVVSAGRLAATLGVRVGVVPGVGHLSHEEDPQALLALLAPFVDTALAGGACGGAEGTSAGGASFSGGGGGGHGTDALAPAV